jgi:hypothetical protein
MNLAECLRSVVGRLAKPKVAHLIISQFILILHLYLHLGLQSGFFLSGFLTMTFHLISVSPLRVKTFQLSALNLIIAMIFTVHLSPVPCIYSALNHQNGPP